MRRPSLDPQLVLIGLLFFGVGALVSAIAFSFSLTQISIVYTISFFVTAAALLGLIYWLQRTLQRLNKRVSQLGDEAHLILRANPAHRVRLTGEDSLAPLANALNQFANRLQELTVDYDTQLHQARGDLELERNQLAALVGELREGVLVCTWDGRILLYNRSASAMLEAPTHESAVTAYVGLGRSIFAMLDRKTIMYALDQLRHRQKQAIGEGEISFVSAALNGRLLRVHISLFGKHYEQANGNTSQPEGYVVALQDMTEGIENSARRDLLIQSLSERVRAAIANVRTASETIDQFPGMSNEQRQRLQQVISEETQGLTQELDQTLSEHTQVIKAQWRLEEMRGADLLWALQRDLIEKLGLHVHTGLVNDSIWLKVDSYALLQAVEWVVRWLSDILHLEQQEVELRLQLLGRFAAFDIVWQADPGETERFQRWKDRLFDIGEDDADITLREVADRHGGEVWFQFDSAGKVAYIRLLLPLAQRQTASDPLLSHRSSDLSSVNGPLPPPPITDQIEFYDFDLFRKSAQTTQLSRRPLRELTYTVFDTETTGLDPQRDEIISIGAVRIVNGRVLRQEIFEQLINPGIPIPQRASKVHGISEYSVRNQPKLSTVLPRFQRFVEDTVLVGHNVAFDMRMLQVKEQVTQIKFENVVLDTLLLAEVVQPGREGHNIESLTRRLGIELVGRHTALGDALMTAEILLRLIPLLEERGVVTIAQAQEAAQKTYYARLK